MTKHIKSHKPVRQNCNRTAIRNFRGSSLKGMMMILKTLTLTMTQYTQNLDRMTTMFETLNKTVAEVSMSLQVVIKTQEVLKGDITKLEQKAAMPQGIATNDSKLVETTSVNEASKNGVNTSTKDDLFSTMLSNIVSIIPLSMIRQYMELSITKDIEKRQRKVTRNAKIKIDTPPATSLPENQNVEIRKILRESKHVSLVVEQTLAQQSTTFTTPTTSDSPMSDAKAIESTQLKSPKATASIEETKTAKDLSENSAAKEDKPAAEEKKVDLNPSGQDQNFKPMSSKAQSNPSGWENYAIKVVDDVEGLAEQCKGFIGLLDPVRSYMCAPKVYIEEADNFIQICPYFKVDKS